VCFPLIVEDEECVFVNTSFAAKALQCTDKKENKIFLRYKDIQMGSGAKSYMRKGFLIYEETRKYFIL
jgi:hypothetical protein